MICDLAETYHIYDYRSLPPTVVATLVAGLRDNSRLCMKAKGIPAPMETLISGVIADRIGCILELLGMNVPSVMDVIYGVPQETEKEEKDNGIRSFESIEEFLMARYGGG